VLVSGLDVGVPLRSRVCEVGSWFLGSVALQWLRGLGVDGRLSYQSSYGFASGQIPRRSQGTLLPSSGEPKVSNLWNNVQRKDSI
jgi:hypothetical protein